MSNPLRIIAAVDLDDTAHTTWTVAASLLANPDAEVSLLHVVRASERDVRADAADVAATISEGHARVQELLARELGDASNPMRDRIDVYVGLGDPATEIVQLAIDLEANLILVGTHEKRGLERMLGSVSSDVFRRAPCSVLVARSRDYAGKEKTPAIAPPLAAGERPMIQAHQIRYRSRPFSVYNASLFPTGIPRNQVR